MYKIIFTKNRPENQSGYTVFINGNLIKNKTDFLFGRSEKSGSFKPLHYQFGNRNHTFRRGFNVI